MKLNKYINKKRKCKQDYVLSFLIAFWFMFMCVYSNIGQHLLRNVSLCFNRNKYLFFKLNSQYIILIRANLLEYFQMEHSDV